MNLSKGQKVELTKGNFDLNEIILGFGWNSSQVTPKISAFLIAENMQIRNNSDFIDSKNALAENNSVEFRKISNNDKENIVINFNRVPHDIKKIVLTISISSNQILNNLNDIYVRVMKNNDELMRYELKEDYFNEAALVIGEVYRHNGEWKFSCIGNGFREFKVLANNFGYEYREEPAMKFGFSSNSNTANSGTRRSHEIDYEIMGETLQVVEVELDPQEKVIAEAGAMNWMDDGISFEAKMGDGSKPQSGFFGNLMEAGKRAVMGESLFVTHFTNIGAGKKRVAFSAPYPGKIMPIDLREYNNEIICQKDAFLCAAYGTALDITFSKKLGAGFFGGEGFILQSIKGDGMAFVHAGGTIVEKKLNGEKIRVDTGCIVGFTNGIDYDIERAGNMKSMFFGGEGLFLATLKGHGTVWLQSLPFSRLADRIIRSAPSVGGESKGEGSILGQVGRLLDGDNF
jgi:uncharacterized protein (TIGR00266 family)